MKCLLDRFTLKDFALSSLMHRSWSGKEEIVPLR